MIVKKIRFKNEDTGTHWIGIAVADNWFDMFWLVDENSDPWQCEFAPITSGSILVSRIPDGDIGFNSEDADLSESLEMDELIEDNSLWKKIDWDKKIGSPYKRLRAL